MTNGDEMRSRKQRRTEKAQANRYDKKLKRVEDEKFRTMKEVLAAKSRPEFRELIMNMDREEMFALIAELDKKPVENDNG